MTHDPPAPSDRLGIHEAATLSHDAFVTHFAGVFEASPWIAEAAFRRGPFTSVDDLHAAMVSVVEEADRGVRQALIRAHPELAGKAAIAGELTGESQREQAAAGLDALTPEQHRDLLALTAAYRERFSFPFVVCVREHTADSIIAAARARLDRDSDAEESTALAEIAKIAALRLQDLVVDEPETRTSG
jgi:OHCU decarboxylase